MMRVGGIRLDKNFAAGVGVGVVVGVFVTPVASVLKSLAGSFLSPKNSVVVG